MPSPGAVKHHKTVDPAVSGSDWPQNGYNAPFEASWGAHATKNYYLKSGNFSDKAEQLWGPYIEDKAPSGWRYKERHWYQMPSAIGANDGRAMTWIDGVKVQDVYAPLANVTPRGAAKPWSTGALAAYMYGNNAGETNNNWTGGIFIGGVSVSTAISPAGGGSPRMTYKASIKGWRSEAHRIPGR